MKKLKFTILSGVMLLLAAMSNLSFTSSSKMDGLTKFNFLVERTADGVKLSSNQGTAWTKTSFDLKVGKSQAINQFGMTSVEKEDRTKDDQLADFLIVITRTDKGFNYEGIRGTAWKKLTYESSKDYYPHVISEEGVEGSN